MSVLLFVDDGNAGHDPGPGMPDRPQRVDACRTALVQAGIDLETRPAEAASPADLGAAHERSYLERLDAFCRKGGGWIDADTPAGPLSFEVAARAAGACCGAVDAALESGARSFCLLRPPGHHATSGQAMGFCLINNVAVGASHALAAGVQKVMIVDIDVHHGNGTQEIFWANPQVLYVSLHQWPWYPWTTGALEETGDADAGGSNVNVPLPEGCGDEVYEDAMVSVVRPIARQFQPQLLMISAGFDAHEADHLSLQRVTSSGYGRMADVIVGLADELCNGAVVFALEGGYNLDALAESVVETVRKMAPGAPAHQAEGSVRKASREVLEPVIAFHSNRWKLG